MLIKTIVGKRYQRRLISKESRLPIKTIHMNMQTLTHSTYQLSSPRTQTQNWATKEISKKTHIRRHL